MITETYAIEGEREFNQEFSLPGLTVTGHSGPFGKTAKTDALWQAINIWRQDNKGWWNGGCHGCGNFKTTTLLVTND